MLCPFCGHNDTSVKDSRVLDASIRRRRVCGGCGARFTTYERVQLKEISVIKRSGKIVLFDRDKLAESIQRAMYKHEFEPLERVVSSVVRQIETSGVNEVTTQEIGNLVLSALYNLDQMAYVRFASVYKQFKNIDDWQHFIKELEHHSDNNPF